jgi:hypothetical protein
MVRDWLSGRGRSKDASAANCIRCELATVCALASPQAGNLGGAERFVHHGTGTAAIDWEATVAALDAGGLPGSAGENGQQRVVTTQNDRAWPLATA